MAIGRITGASFVFVTFKSKAAKESLPTPFVAVITMFAVPPTSSFVGIPLRRPLRVLNVAHDGLFVMLHEVISPLVAFISA